MGINRKYFPRILKQPGFEYSNRHFWSVLLGPVASASPGGLWERQIPWQQPQIYGSRILEVGLSTLCYKSSCLSLRSSCSNRSREHSAQSFLGTKKVSHLFLGFRCLVEWLTLYAVCKHLLSEWISCCTAGMGPALAHRDFVFFIFHPPCNHEQ